MSPAQQHSIFKLLERTFIECTLVFFVFSYFNIKCVCVCNQNERFTVTTSADYSFGRVHNRYTYFHLIIYTRPSYFSFLFKNVSLKTGSYICKQKRVYYIYHIIIENVFFSFFLFLIRNFALNKNKIKFLLDLFRLA